MRIASVIFCLFSISFAWLLPERCEQEKTPRVRRTLTAATAIKNGPESNIENIAAQQHTLLKETYKDHQFLGVPIRAACEDNDMMKLYIYVPYNCAFKTYAPRLLSSVVCQSSACKLTHTVSTVDSYTASEGYNWGVKISSKASVLKVFEVGGEVSTTGTYSCTYSKGRTTTDTVECSESSGKGGVLQLYNVKSDMECDFGKIFLHPEKRDGSYFGFINNFTQRELEHIQDSAAFQADTKCLVSTYFIDTNKISERIFQKLMHNMPHFNPYTDVFHIQDDYSDVSYYKQNQSIQEYRKTIPFTTEGGDSVFQYACVLTPF